jgi:4-carboxymuconolactone decarboxylase
LPRIPELIEAELTPQQVEVYAILAAGRKRGVAGPLLAFLHSPELARLAQKFGGFCRRGTRLSDRLSELAILTVVSIWKAGFAWHSHRSLAEAAGIAPETTDALLRGAPPDFVREDEAAVYDFVREIVTTRKVRDDTLKRLGAIFDPPAMVELIAIIGYYTMISMTITAFELDPGTEGDPFGAGP